MYDLGDIVEMKKPHACQANRWQACAWALISKSSARIAGILS
ncbi:hypothetical protein HMPREF9520_01168 [Enterococcus faecalis TX1467]|nr:hypothetical protein HMPREF9520_01168 [Enterococcus faecalis TX1467]